MIEVLVFLLIFMIIKVVIIGGASYFLTVALLLPTYLIHKDGARLRADIVGIPFKVLEILKKPSCFMLLALLLALEVFNIDLPFVIEIILLVIVIQISKHYDAVFPRLRKFYILNLITFVTLFTVLGFGSGSVTRTFEAYFQKHPEATGLKAVSETFEWFP